MSATGTNNDKKERIPVYQLLKRSLGSGGSHQVNREEAWEMKLVKDFADYETALRFAQENEMKTPEFLKHVPGMNPNDEKLKQEAVEELYKNPDLWYRRTYFVETVPRQEIVDALKKQGIRRINM